MKKTHTQERECFRMTREGRSSLATATKDDPVQCRIEEEPYCAGKTLLYSCMISVDGVQCEKKEQMHQHG